MQEQVVEITNIATDRDGVAVAQQSSDNTALVAAVTASFTGGVSIAPNGSLAGGGICVLPKASVLTITSGVDASGVSFTINGRNDRGETVQEVITGPNNTTVTGAVQFRTITGIVPSINGTLDFDVGAFPVDAVLLSQPFVLSTARKVTIYSGSDLSGLDFTIVGADRNGNPLSETLTGPDTETVTSLNVFGRIDRVYADAAITSDIEVGWATESVSALIVPSYHANPFSIGMVATILDNVSSLTYTVEHTMDDIQAPGFNEGTANWLPHASLVDETASGDGNYAFAMAAFRLRIDSGEGTVELRARQAGF